MQDGRKAIWSIPYVSVAFFPNFIAYCSSKVSDCIFEIRQLWQSGFSKVYSNSCCSSSFGPKIIKIGQSSYKMYSNNFQESTAILNACTKSLEPYWRHLIIIIIIIFILIYFVDLLIFFIYYYFISIIFLSNYFILFISLWNY